MESASSTAEPRLCQAPRYEDADIDGMNQQQLRKAAKELRVSQKQLTPALREACKRAARERREEEVSRESAPGGASSQHEGGAQLEEVGRQTLPGGPQYGEHDFDDMTKKI